jgi:hypothetical protein
MISEVAIGRSMNFAEKLIAQPFPDRL